MYLNVINILKFYIVVKRYRKRITRKVSVICRVLVKTADTACCKHCKISLNINIFAVLAVTDYTETFIVFFDYINHCEVFDNRYVVKLLYRRQKM